MGKEKETDTSEFYLMLKRAYVEGLIQDAALLVEDGIGKIKAFDMSTVLFVESTCDNVPLNDGEYGFGDLGIITNYLKSNTSGSLSIKVSKNRMNIIVKGHGKLMYLLTEPEVIGSRPDPDEDQPSADDILPLMKYSIPLNEATTSDVLNYIKLIKPRSITITTAKKGMVNINAGQDSEHKFSVKIGKLTEKKIPDISISVLTDYFVSVLNILTWDNVVPELLLKKNEDIVIKQDEKNIWVVQALTSEDDFDFEEE